MSASADQIFISRRFIIMNTDRSKTLRMVMLAMMVAIGVVISPILRIEGMCPTAHLINIVCSVLLGPWYSLLCATLIGIIRMMFMGIPPLALTGAVFGAFLSGVFYRASHGKVGRPKEPPLESPSEPYVSLSTHTAPSPTDGNIPNFQCANKFLSLLATAPSQCSALLLVFFFL